MIERVIPPPHSTIMPLFRNPNAWRYISDLSKVGTHVDSDSNIDSVGPEHTFDVIIVGGGELSLSETSKVLNAIHRDIGVCTGFPLE